jgi:hypothetical protein
MLPLVKSSLMRREQKYRLLLLRAISNLLEGAIKNIDTFKPEHVITKNRSIH